MLAATVRFRPRDYRRASEHLHDLFDMLLAVLCVTRGFHLRPSLLLFGRVRSAPTAPKRDAIITNSIASLLLPMAELPTDDVLRTAFKIRFAAAHDPPSTIRSGRVGGGSRCDHFTFHFKPHGTTFTELISSWTIH
jgi:hypothetical protein